MYEITVEETFDAAHCINDYPGSCARLHGHTYRVCAAFQTDELDDKGMAIDFRHAKSVLRGVLEHFDHTYLNETDIFAGKPTTAESIAKTIYGMIKPKIDILVSVSVWETPTSCATYSEKKKMI